MKYALSAKHSLLFADLSLIGCSKKYFKASLNIDYSFPECLIRGDDLFWNYDNDAAFDKAFLYRRTLNGAVKIFNNSLLRVTKNLEKVTIKISRLEKNDINKKGKLKSLFTQYINAYLLNMPFLFQYWNTENLIINQLKIDFKELFGIDEGEYKLQQVLIPSQETYFAKERKSIEEITLYILKTSQLKTIFQREATETISIKVNKLPKLKAMLDKHLKLFGFTSFTFNIGIPLGIKTVLERLKELLKEDIVKKLKINKQHKLNDREEISNILKRISSFPDIRKRILMAQELMFWKNQRLDILFKSDLRVKPLFEKIAELMGLSYQEFVYLRVTEIKSWFRAGELPSKQEIRKRMKSYCLYLKDGKVLFFIDKNKYPKVKDNSSLNKIQSDKDSVKGSVAYRGIVQGKVRLVNLTDDIKRVQRGEILITKMTRPEMILGLERAAAFVTDQGGMLSHAAIVSREMKKPCIVGTKIATQVFKNGDLIEVDANSGIVRKLN